MNNFTTTSATASRMAISDSSVDTIVQAIYRAGTGLTEWVEPLKKIEAAFGAWVVQFLGFDKRNGAVTFSYESGTASPECALDYFRRYSLIDPRAVLLFGMPDWKTPALAPISSHFACKARPCLSLPGSRHMGARHVEDGKYGRKLVFPTHVGSIQGTIIGAICPRVAGTTGHQPCLNPVHQ